MTPCLASPETKIDEYVKMSDPRRRGNSIPGNLMKKNRFLAVAAGLALSAAAIADTPDPTAMAKGISLPDSVWMVVATVLVLVMTPALAMFYGGMVRRKNALSSMMHSFIMMGVISIVWLFLTYSLAFGKTSNGFIGNLEYAWGHIPMAHANTDGAVPNIPAGLHMLYQLMFAIITPALISGAVAERMKFGAYVAFTTIWSIVVYAPIACWVWNDNGWLNKLGALDFAGGTVVHFASGMAALAACLMLGKRKAVENKEPILPNNLTMTLVGAGLLWFGWIGFNAGSALALNKLAIGAFVATHMAAAAGMIGWLICEKLRIGKATALGAASGLVAGLVAITPAAGYVQPVPGALIGFIAGIVCCYSVNLKYRFGFDDSLDVVGVHGVGGFLGAILTGVFASIVANPTIADQLKGGQLMLIFHQFIGAIVIGAFSFVASLIILATIKAFTPLRATEEEEIEGMDEALHGEAAYNL